MWDQAWGRCSCGKRGGDAGVFGSRLGGASGGDGDTLRERRGTHSVSKDYAMAPVSFIPSDFFVFPRMTHTASAGIRSPTPGSL